MKKSKLNWKSVFSLKREKTDVWDYLLFKLSGIAICIFLIKLFWPISVNWLILINLWWSVAAVIIISLIIIFKGLFINNKG